MMAVSVKNVGAWTGFVSALAIMIAFVLVGFAYEGRIGEPYSPLNHFVSELGEVGISQMAWLFNSALIIGGIGILLGFIALTMHLRGWFRYLVLLLGFITGVSGTLVGVFPMNQLEAHLTVALTFFNTGWMVTAVFSLYVLFARQTQFPRWLAIPGFVTAVAFVVFSNYNDSFLQGSQSIDEVLGAARPETWGIAILEWVVVLAVLIWVALICGVMIRLNTRETAPTLENVSSLAH